MLERLLNTGVELGWSTADEAYGDNPGLRAWLQEVDLNYVLAVSCDQHFTTPKRPCAPRKGAGSACRPGWAARTTVWMTGYWRIPEGDEHLLLVRRSISKPTELAYQQQRIKHPRLPLPY